MIQREAGVSKSTVYAHYANKEALFTAVIEAECAPFTNTVHGIEFRPGKLRETLTMLAKAYLDIVLSPGGLALFRVVIAEGDRKSDVSGKSVSVRVDLGGRRSVKKKTQNEKIV